jgi:uncharacterized protein YcaQ
MQLKLSLRQARRLAVVSQGLAGARPFGRGKRAVLRCLKQLGYVQIDTISVINRSHHHTLWVRCPDYRPEYLTALQERDREVFEYWSHAAAYLPTSEYRFSLPRKNAIQNGEHHWFEPNHELMAEILRRIQNEGALMARDFTPNRTRQSSPWWGWNSMKRSLEQLFIEGRLMVPARKGFQKIYDLPERVIPSGVPTEPPDDSEYAEHLIRNFIRANGTGSLSELTYLRKGIRPLVESQVTAMVKSGEILPVKLGSIKETYYTSPDALQHLNRRVRKRVHLLSPFDNLIIQRSRTKRVFRFDYRLECYVPKAKRVYGYFCLPILWGDRLVGVLDPKAERKTGNFMVRKLAVMSRAKLEQIIEALAPKLADLAQFNGCHRITVQTTSPSALAPMLHEAVRSALEKAD